ncbi:MAG: hypothetical protein H0X62_15900, partial [Bacteroidetes bacterium]|nr:hypothetical protein [Bacteroidota bacterium]
METGKEKVGKPSQLLNPTERLIREKKAALKVKFGKGNIEKLIHELQVYQIELELQNEELKRTKKEADIIKVKY